MALNPKALLVRAKETLLLPNDLDDADLARVIGSIATPGVDHADLYFQYSRSEAWSLEEGIVKSGSFNIDQGVGVRAVSGEKTAFAYTDDLNLSSIADAASAVRAISAAGQDVRIKTTSKLKFSKSARRELYAPIDPLPSLDAESKVGLLEKLESYARAENARVIQVMASIAGEYEIVLVARSDGAIAADARPLVRVSLTVIVEGTNGRREQGSFSGGGRTDYACFDDDTLRAYARSAVHQALVNL
ncbi:MAG: metalloprotease TldD, partial [Candidatus Accumulibacter sp.]|nr:metalloprotease TldD [Accumulibacter sp.]